MFRRTLIHRSGRSRGSSWSASIRRPTEGVSNQGKSCAPEGVVCLFCIAKRDDRLPFARGAPPRPAKSVRQRLEEVLPSPTEQRARISLGKMQKMDMIPLLYEPRPPVSG